jgi:transposase InsO family protein
MDLLHYPTVHATPIPLHLATSDATGGIVATGSVCLLSPNNVPLWLHHVQCVPSAIFNILSVSAALRDGAVFSTDNVGAFTAVSGPNQWNTSVHAEKGLYFVHHVFPVSTAVKKKYASAAQKSKSVSVLSHDCARRYLWHSRMGHPGEPWMQRLSKENLVLGLDTSLSPCPNCPSSCEACIEGKNTRPSFGVSSRPALVPLDRVHIDTVGPIYPAAVTGERFWVTVVDESSQWKAVIPVKTKDVIGAAVRDLLVYWQTQRGTTVKCIRCDRGTEFINARFKEFCVSQGTKLETSAPYTPQQNGVAERANRTLKERARTILAFAAASPTLWKEALETACTVLNMGPSTDRQLTPAESFFGQKPDVTMLRTWGCLVYVHVPDTQRSVFSPKAVPGMFTGYSSSSKAYRIYLGGGVWRESRDVVFLEHIRGGPQVGMGVQSHQQPTQNPDISPNHSRTPFPAAVPGQVVPYFDSEEDEAWQVPSSSPPSSNSPQQALPEPSGEAATEPNPQRNDFAVEAPEATSTDNAGPLSEAINEDWKVLEAHRALARDHPRAARMPAELARAQEVLRPDARGPGDPSYSHSDGLTRAQRYEQRTNVKDSLLAQGGAESSERVGTTESDTLSQGSGEAKAGEIPCANPESHVSAVRGTAYPKAACDPSVLSRMGGTCSVPVGPVSAVRCGNDPGSPSVMLKQRTHSGASHRLEGKLMPSSMSASFACEGSQGSGTWLACERNNEEVKQLHGHKVLFPNYKCSPRGTCVWEKDVSDERCSAVTTQSLQNNSETYWQQGKQSIPGTPARSACEGHAGTASQHACQGREEEVNQSAKCCRAVPDYKCTLRGTCAWEEDVSVGSSKFTSAECESKRERELKTSHKPTERIASCSAANFSGRVVGSGSTEAGHKVQQEGSSKHTGVRLSKIHVPSNLREAQRSPQWEYWKAAMQEEQNSLDAHDVMEYVPRPHGHKVIHVHWIFSVKTDAHGNILRFKARLVAQGCRQIPGVDVMEVFAPTSTYGSRRALLAVAAKEGFEIHQVDVKTAFLNGELEEEVYVTQAPGFENGDHNTVCRLRKALYGLKQAPRAWHKTLNEKLEVMGYDVCKSDAGVYVRCSVDGGKSSVLIYVDDLLIVSKG